MEKIANSQELAAQLSQLGLERAKKFSWDKTGIATVEVLSRYL